jgi:hypothetical protein
MAAGVGESLCEDGLGLADQFLSAEGAKAAKKPKP